MSAQKIVAVLLIVVGALGVGFGGFSYTSETHDVDLGPIHLAVQEKEHINIPLWAGVGAIFVGGMLLLVRQKIF